MNLFRTLSLLACCALGVVAFGTGPRAHLDADEFPAASTATDTQVALLQETGQQEKKKRAQPRGRLPNNYGQLGISQQQREKIYGIQAKYREQMEELEKQLADLRTKRDAEVEAVLTAEQKKKLEELRAAAKKADASGESTEKEGAEKSSDSSE